MEDFATLIKEAAESIGVQAIRVWPDIVAVYWIQNVVKLLLIPLVIVICITIAWKLGYKACTIHNCDLESLYGFSASVIAFLAAMLVIFYVLTLGSMISAVHYPEASLIFSKIQ